MKPYQPSAKIAVRDCLDDDFSDEVEDDVFIRDGKMSRVNITGGNAVDINAIFLLLAYLNIVTICPCSGIRGKWP